MERLRPLKAGGRLRRCWPGHKAQAARSSSSPIAVNRRSACSRLLTCRGSTMVAAAALCSQMLSTCTCVCFACLLLASSWGALARADTTLAATAVAPDVYAFIGSSTEPGADDG